MTNTDCSAKITKQQKKLLKVLNCNFQHYVVNKAIATQDFMANPKSDSYTQMVSELISIVNTIICMLQ